MSDAASHLVDQAWEAIEEGRFLWARSLIRRLARFQDHRAEALHLRGALALQVGAPREAVRLLERSREMQGGRGDLLYDLGLAHEALGDRRAMIAAFLEVLDIDAQADPGRDHRLTDQALTTAAEAELAALPGEILSRLGHVPILIEERPPRYLVEEGFDPRSLGLFEGLPYPDQGASGPALCRIVLYRANLAAAARSKSEAADLVRTTLLHETAHFFGLDEDDLAARGLA